jgi:hypothetical protein
MKCPYINPTIQQCTNCPIPGGCVKNNTDYQIEQIRKWQKNKPDKVRQYAKNKRANYTPEKKQSELQRLLDWKAHNPAKVKRSVNRCGKRYRKAHMEQEKVRNHVNYLKRKERQAG